MPFVTHEDRPVRGNVCQLVATWNNEVILAPDPANNGRPNPGIAGRVYLFGQNVDHPRAGDGKIVVDMYDASKPENPVMVERWEFDKVTLQRLLRRDTIGWGYTLFLPMGSYNPEVPVHNVILKTSHQPDGAAPHFTENTLTLNRPGGNNYRKTSRQEALVPAPQGNQSPRSAAALRGHSPAGPLYAQ
jgi:hypothetical protein